MELYMLAITCVLLQGVSGKVTIIDVELYKAGALVEGTHVDAKLNDEVIIKCLYNNPPVQQVPAIYHKADDSAALQQISSAGGELQQPWQDRAHNFEIVHAEDAPYFMQFKIKRIEMVDKGIYVCTVNNYNGAIDVQNEVTVSVAANVKQVEIEGVVDDKYKVEVGEVVGRTEVICRAYNGSTPEMTLKIEGVADPILPEQTSNPTPNEYEATFYYDLDASLNGKKMTCEAIVPGYELDKVFASATLEIVAKPVINCPTEIKTNLPKTATISCTITGNPLPPQSNILWIVQKTGHEIPAESSSSSLGLVSTIELDGDVYNAELKVTIINEQTFGTYVLTAQSDGGHATAYVLISKKTETITDGGGGACTNSACGTLLLLTLAGYLLL